MLEKELQTEIEEREGELLERPASLAEKSLPFLVLLLVIFVDHLSKLFVEIWLPINTTWAPAPSLAGVFRITHVSNTGAAFGLIPSGSIVFMIVAVIVAIVILIYNFRLPAGYLLYRVSFGLMVGGALGNFISRVRIGHVTDFLDFGPWPVFNLADLSIVTGTCLMGYLMLREEWSRKDRKSVTEQDEKKRDPDTAEDPGIL